MSTYTSKAYYYVAPTTIKNLTKSGTTKMKATWSKNSKATGYQIQYATSKSFASAKTTKITSNATLSKTITRLTKNKKACTNYVRIRVYKTVSSVNYYSDWSTAKNVK